MDRRLFLKGIGGACAAGASLVVLPPPSFAQAGLSAITFDQAAIPNNFGRRAIIKAAMDLVATYFRDARVVGNVYQYLRGGSFLYDDTMKNSNIIDNVTNRNNLLSTQITQLRGARQNGRSWFPRVVFKTADHDRVAWAWAAPNKVTVKLTTPTTSTISGEFEIQVSLRYLGGGGNQSDPRVWASVIAHEMLHNLGHKHPLQDYRPVWQINVFQNAMYCRGVYRGQLVPGFV
jgi:hypothetical protein